MPNPNAESVPAKPGFLKLWWIAMRPFSFTASGTSVVFGTALAAVMAGAKLNVLYAVLATVGMVLMHGAANIHNDAEDFDKGLDSRVLPVSGAVVRGFITPARARRGAVVIYTIGCAIGLFLFSRVGMPVLIVGVVGLVVGITYSLTPRTGLKYHALGDLSVFVDFGILGSLGGWAVQTGELSWLPALWSVPLSLLVIGILHANNWRDIESDTARGCTTVASLLGDGGSAVYYAFLLFLPFVLVGVYMIVPRLAHFAQPMPWSFAITLLALPLALRLLRRAQARKTSTNPLDFLALDGGTAQLNFAFGALCIAATALAALLPQVK